MLSTQHLRFKTHCMGQHTTVSMADSCSGMPSGTIWKCRVSYSNDTLCSSAW